MNSMKVHEIATRLFRAVEPFANSVELENIEEFLDVGEEGLALRLSLWVATENRIVLEDSLIADLQTAAPSLGDRIQQHVASISAIAA